MSGYANRTEGFKGIHDPIYVRAIVVDDGAAQVAIVAWELISVPDGVWAEVSPRIAELIDQGAGEMEIGRVAAEDDLVPMSAHATGLARSQVTTMDEVRRVIDLAGGD